MSGLRLDGRVAAVTGAGRGIGRAYALLLGQLGAKVVVNDLGGSTLGAGGDAAPADEVVKQIEAAGGAAVANYGDVSRSFNTLHAAWPYFLEKNYGRAILTTSVGLFGLMDNIGYAIAKASMIGMAKSLTVGRKEANINVNCIAPNAMTRLAARTEDEQAKLPPPPPEMDPVNVAPMVAYLHPGLNGATVDDVAANWAQINDEAGYYVPSDLMDWAGHYLSHLGR